jgi:hypothetical protein
VPFTFYIDLPGKDNAETPNAGPARLTIARTIEEDILQHPSKAFTPEDILVVRCSPQAVFRVRPATRCSSTLSGAKENFCSCNAILKVGIRSRIAHTLCILLAYWSFTRDWIRRQYCAPMESGYRNPFAYSERTYWMGSVC